MLEVRFIAGTWCAYDIWKRKVVATFATREDAEDFVHWGIEQ